MENFLNIEMLIIPINAIIIYIMALLLVRITDKRILSNLTAFDIIVTIILGSTLSRAINGSAPLIPSIAAGAVIVFLHLITAILSFHSSFFRSVLRGKHVTLIKDGKINWNNMRKTHIPENDLLIELRKQINDESLQSIKEARMETCGTITFIKKQQCEEYPMKEQKKNTEFPKVYNSAMQSMLECFSMCTACSKKCIEEQHKTTAAICEECADICSLAIKASSGESTFESDILKLCKTACLKCAEECKKMDAEHCQECAKVCQQCAEVCTSGK